MAQATSGDEWWKGAIFYQIYPRSFKDNNGDGVGDLPGITEKLDYIAALNVDALWICPFYKSPMRDFGYDVADFEDVDPLFGTLDDFRALLEKAHRLGLKVVIDQIISHTSDEHPWFKESRRTAFNAKKDWYVWCDPATDGSAPTNWLSRFGGPAWTYAIRRGQYYLHNFYASQPDLNLHNPEVVEAVLNAMEFWLKMGVDGFRMDAVSYYLHDRQLRKNPPRPRGERFEGLSFIDPCSMQEHRYNRSSPKIFDLLEKIRGLMDKYPGTVTLGEASGDSSDKTMEMAIRYTEGNKYLHTAYSHTLIAGNELTADFIRSHVERFEEIAQGKAWPSWAFSNHDVIRAMTRFNRERDPHPDFAKLLMALLTSLKGTPVVYQGEELGMTQPTLPFEALRDHWGIFLYPEWQGRDGARTPVPWRDELGAGFSATTDTWLPVPDDHRTICVETQEHQKDSPLLFTRAFFEWRRTVPALIKGDIVFLNFTAEVPHTVLGFIRVRDEDAVLCLFNLSDEPLTMKAPPEIDGESLYDAGAQTIAYDPSKGTVAMPAYGLGWFSVKSASMAAG
ncbi:MAG: alpha glucosidase [Alphaproteobacteria bacterium]|nr:alpha glucosidase [Alphaproteobacteria bacterium]